MKAELNLEVVEIIRETPDTITIVFDIPNDLKMEYKPGQFLMLIFEIDGVKYKRAYSLSSSPGIDKSLSVTVKQVNGGFVSTFINQTLRVGDKISSAVPRGKFVIEPNPLNQRQIFFFAAGSGIAPLFSMMKSILHHEPKSSVNLIYSNRNEDSIIYKSKLDSFLKDHSGRIKIYDILSKPSEKWTGFRGRLNPDTINHILDGASSTNEISIEKPTDLNKSEFYLCGPVDMMDTIVQTLLSRGIDISHIHCESFGGNMSKYNNMKRKKSTIH